MDRKRKLFLTFGATIAVLVMILAIAYDGQWPSKDDATGAIGAANKYRAEQISDADVVLKDAGIQALLQNDEFQKLIADKEFQELLAHNDIQKALAHAGFLNALAHANNAVLRDDMNDQPMFGFAGIQSTLAFINTNPELAKDPVLQEKLAYAGIDAAVAYASSNYGLKSVELRTGLGYAGAPQILSFALNYPQVIVDPDFEKRLAYAGLESALAYASSNYAINSVDLKEAFGFAGAAHTLAYALGHPQIAGDEILKEKLAFSGFESALAYATLKHDVDASEFRSAFGYAGAARVLSFALGYPQIAGDEVMREKLSYAGIDAAIAYAANAYQLKSSDLRVAFGFSGAPHALAFSSKYASVVQDSKFQEALAFSGIEAAISYASNNYSLKSADLRAAFGFAGAAKMVAFMSTNQKLADDPVFRDKLAYAGLEAAMAYAASNLSLKSVDLREAFGFSGAPQALAYAGAHPMLMKDATFTEMLAHSGIEAAIAYASENYSLKTVELQEAFGFAGAAEVLAYASSHQELLANQAFQDKLAYAGIEAAIAYASNNLSLKSVELREAFGYASVRQTLAYAGSHPMLMKDATFRQALAFSGIDAAIAYASSNYSLKSSELREAFGYAGAAQVLAFASNYPNASSSEALGYAGMRKILSFASSNPTLASDLGLLMQNSTIQTALAHGNFNALTPDM